MIYVYHIYGLRVGFSRPISFLNDTGNPEQIDVMVNITEGCPSVETDRAFRFWELADGGLGFFIKLTSGNAEYRISSTGRSILVTHVEQVPLLEILPYLMGVALGAALRYQGALCLHASAISIGGSAVAFVGTSGTGKSTLSAAFHRRGFPLVSEDLLAVNLFQEMAFVRPGYGGVRLYPEALNHVYGSSAAEKAVRIDHKLLYMLDNPTVVDCPLQAIYVLAPRNPDLLQPQITIDDKAEALLVLTSHLYLHRQAGERWLARDFPRLGKLLQLVPIYRLERTDRLSDLDTAIDLILGQYALSTRNTVAV